MLKFLKNLSFGRICSCVGLSFHILYYVFSIWSIRPADPEEPNTWGLFVTSLLCITAAFVFYFFRAIDAFGQRKQRFRRFHLWFLLFGAVFYTSCYGYTTVGTVLCLVDSVLLFGLELFFLFQKEHPAPMTHFALPRADLYLVLGKLWLLLLFPLCLLGLLCPSWSDLGLLLLGIPCLLSLVFFYLENRLRFRRITIDAHTISFPPRIVVTPQNGSPFYTAQRITLSFSNLIRLQKGTVQTNGKAVPAYCLFDRQNNAYQFTLSEYGKTEAAILEALRLHQLEC